MSEFKYEIIKELGIISERKGGCVFNLGGVPLDNWFQLHLPAVEINGYWSLDECWLSSARI